MTTADVEALAELRDWGRSLADADRALNIPGQHAMVQSSSVGRDLIRYADRIAEAAEEKAEQARRDVLRELPVSLVECVRSSGRPGVLIARDAGITTKHLSQMLNHHVGSINTWVRVIRAARTDWLAGS